jgi:hypothetical protein
VSELNELQALANGNTGRVLRTVAHRAHRSNALATERKLWTRGTICWLFCGPRVQVFVSGMTCGSWLPYLTRLPPSSGGKIDYRTLSGLRRFERRKQSTFSTATLGKSMDFPMYPVSKFVCANLVLGFMGLWAQICSSIFTGRSRFHFLCGYRRGSSGGRGDSNGRQRRR